MMGGFSSEQAIVRARVSVGPRSVDKRTGTAGGALVVTAGVKYPKAYSVQVHGLTAELAAAAVVAVEARHAAKELKVDELAELVGTEFAVEGEQFRIVDATVMDRGSDAELVMQLRRLVDGVWVLLSGMPIRRVVGAIENIPSASAAEAIAVNFATALVDAENEHATFAAAVLELLEDQ